MGNDGPQIPKKVVSDVILVVRRKSMKNDGSRLKFNGKIGAPKGPLDTKKISFR